MAGLVAKQLIVGASSLHPAKPHLSNIRDFNIRAETSLTKAFVFIVFPFKPVFNMFLLRKCCLARGIEDNMLSHFNWSIWKCKPGGVH